MNDDVIVQEVATIKKCQDKMQRLVEKAHIQLK